MESTAISSDEEDALSLSDLPLENQVQPRNEENGEPQAFKTDEDFNFGSLTDPQMCSADQVFFKGQILPLWNLVWSDSGCRWSESMDHGSLSGFTSVSSDNTTTNSIAVSNSNSKSINFRNKLSTDPSPKPQVSMSKTRPVNVGIRNQTWSMWGAFRLGVVRAPELELQDLKVRRNTVSRNSKVVKNKKVGQVSKKQQDLNKGFIEKRIMRMYSGCKCSANVVETVPLNNVVFIKRNKKGEKKNAISVSAMEEKKLQHELKMKKMKEKGKNKASFLTSLNALNV